MSEEEIEREVNVFLARMSEHVDAVQVLVTHQTLEGTAIYKKGIGNWFARKGMASQFLEDAQNDDIVFKMHQIDEEEDE